MSKNSAIFAGRIDPTCIYLKFEYWDNSKGGTLMRENVSPLFSPQT